MDSEKEWLDSVLLKYCQCKGFESVRTKDFSPIGDGVNFTSDLQRVQIEVKENSGRARIKTILMKKVLPNLLENTMMKEWELFETEIKMYTKILPFMGQFLRGDEQLWPRYVGHRDSDRLLLEDMKEEGYGMAVRTEGLDLEHCLVALRGLAKYHALSVAAVEAGQTGITTLPPYVFGGGLGMTNQYLENSFTSACRATTPLWPPEMKYYKESLNKFARNFISNLLFACNPENVPLKVLNHGDCWVNNMLFRYDAETKKPVSMRFVDFQMSHYGSFAMDLQYFMGTSLSREVREMEEGVLMREYHEALLRELEGLGMGRKSPRLEEVESELERCEPVGLMAAVTILPLVLSRDDQLPNKTGYEEWEARLKRAAVRFANPDYAAALLQVLQKSSQAGRLRFLD